MTGAQPRRSYLRQAIPLAGATTSRDVLRLLRYPDLAVNVVDTNGVAALLSTGTLDAALRAKPAALTLDFLQEAMFHQLALGKIAGGLRDEEGLRRRLCLEPVGTLRAEVERQCRYLEELMVLLTVYTLQRRNATVTRVVRALPRVRTELLDAAAVRRDNVRCADILRYELRPLLETLGAAFER